MKTKKLLLLCLFALIFMSVNARQHQKEEKTIRLEKLQSSVNKNKRSIALSNVFAYLNSDSELISVDFKSIVDSEVSVTNLFTNETIFTDSYSTPEIILNLAGLLNEGEEYRLEITIGDTLLYGDFIY